MGRTSQISARLSGRAENGFVSILRAIVRHLEDGRLSTMEFTALALMVLRADPATGVWRGCASYLALLTNRSTSERAVQRALEGLEKKGYVKRFVPPGRCGNYPILLHGHEVAEGPRRGTRLNAVATSDWKNPVYESAQRAGEMRDCPVPSMRGKAEADSRGK